jgi:urea transport system permease protein
MARKFTNRELLIVGLISFLGLVVLPCLNAFPRPTTRFTWRLTLSLYGNTTYAVLAMGVNLLWGYTDYSLGQCVFFALVATLGMYLMLLIAKLGQYRADLPDFMVSRIRDKVSRNRACRATGFHSIASGLPRRGAKCRRWSPSFGFLAFRSRIKGVYFSI